MIRSIEAGASGYIEIFLVEHSPPKLGFLFEDHSTGLLATASADREGSSLAIYLFPGINTQ